MIFDGGALGPAPVRRRQPRRARVLTRTLPLISVAAVAFGLGIYAAGAGGRAERRLVTDYVTEWATQDFPAMYALLDPASRNGITERAFALRYRSAAATATLVSLRADHVGGRRGGVIPVLMTVRTRIFGTVHATLRVPLAGSGGSARVRFDSELLFPGLLAGEQLSRHTLLGQRGTLLADDGTVLAQGPSRTSALPLVSNEIVGRLGPIPVDERAQYAAAGYPADALVGLDGLERIFQRRLRGRIGGTLLAGHRVLADAIPGNGPTVRTTIDPAVEESAISALAGQYGGMTVMDPRTGAILALAGIAFSGLQPPGSTMKIITSVGAIEAGLATVNTTYPYASSVTLDGYELKNNGNESCGGTLLNAFAESCNSVFAPLGAQLGAARLVATAERFGFNSPSPLAGAPESTIPPAPEIGDALAVGSSAIGQGMVQANTLEIADVGATIADGGRRPIPTLSLGARPRFVRVTPAGVARQVQAMMEAVVRYGTGTLAQIPGVVVAGKTGTAELQDTGSQKNAVKATDAWFVGYAPVGHATVVAAALFPNAGFGATTATPPVRAVLVTALQPPL